MPRKTPTRNLSFFLKQLERTGNITLAAECAGLARSGIHKRKRRDPEFAAEVARAQASWLQSKCELVSKRATRPADDPQSGIDRLHSRDGKSNLTAPNALVFSRYAGKPQRRRLPAGRLTGLGITNFFAALANTGNLRLAARAVGVAHSSILWRRDTDPAFAEEMQAALDIARDNIELALIRAADRTFAPDWEDGVDPDGLKMTVGQMLWFLSIRRA